MKKIQTYSQISSVLTLWISEMRKSAVKFASWEEKKKKSDWADEKEGRYLIKLPASTANSEGSKLLITQNMGNYLSMNE